MYKKFFFKFMGYHILFWAPNISNLGAWVATMFRQLILLPDMCLSVAVYF